MRISALGRRVLLLGHTGKMGTALAEAFADDHEVVGVGSRDVDAADFPAVAALVERTEPDLVVNTVARLGIDACEREPSLAMKINAMLPRLLGRLASERGFTLVHFSTECVFSGRKGEPLAEGDEPDPVNIYGYSKFAGDLAVRDATERHYIFRLPVLFGEGPKRGQLVERMIDRAEAGEAELRIADDIVTSPTYALDAAHTVRSVVEGDSRPGLYHLANHGQASLHELMREMMANLGLRTRVHRASYRDFPSLAEKNTFTPLRSGKLAPLRSWRDATAAYCARRVGAPPPVAESHPAL